MTRKAGWRLAVGILLAVSSWPYLGNLHLWPTTTDGVVWITQYMPHRPDWLEQVFATRHLNVGYRPVAALSYALVSLASDLDPLGYRLFSVALHLLCGLLVFTLCRRLDRGANAGALLALAIFLAHPLSAAVPSLLSRWSYGLAAVFSLASLIVLWDRLSWLAPRATLLAIIRCGLPSIFLFTCALLSNEVAFVTAGFFSFFAFYRLASLPDHHPSIPASFIVPLIAVLTALTIRFFAVGEIGGYEMAEGHYHSATALLAVFWGALVGFSEVGGAIGFPATAAMFAIVVPYYLWRIGRDVRGHPEEPHERLLLLLSVWLVGFAALALILGYWFPRMAHNALIPFSLLVGIEFSATVRELQRTEGNHSWRSIGRLVPQALLLLAIAIPSPWIQGPDPRWIKRGEQNRRYLTAIQEQLSTLSGPAMVLMVLPFSARQLGAPIRRNEEPEGGDPILNEGEVRPGRGLFQRSLKNRTRTKWAPRSTSRMPLHWIHAALRERDIRMRDFLFYRTSEMASEIRPSIRWVADRPALVIPPNLPFHMTAFGDIQQSEFESVVWLDRIRQRKGVKLYLLMSRAGALELFEIRVGTSTF